DAPRLGDLATICGAATVAEAYALRDALHEGEPGDGVLRAVNSGTLDPLRCLWGNKPLRYLGRTLRRPVVPLEALPPRRAAQAVSPKIVVAGMTRRLEPVLDADGTLAALKSTTL